MMDDHDEAPDHESDNALKRIADILGVPTASFFTPVPSRRLEITEEAAFDGAMTQALAVMRLFLRLKDPEARARCVTFITQELLHDR